MQLVDFLMARGRLDAVQRDRVLAVRRERGDSKSESVTLTRLGMIGEREMAQCLAEFLDIPLTTAEDYPIVPVPAGELSASESESVILTRLGMIREREIAQSPAEFLTSPLTPAEDYRFVPVPAGELSADFIARAQILPLRDAPDGIALAMADPNDDYTVKAVRLAVGKPVLPWAAVPRELAAALEGQ